MAPTELELGRRCLLFGDWQRGFLLLRRTLKMTNGTMFLLSFNRLRLGLLALLCILSFAEASAQAQQFSADIVTTRQDGAVMPAGKLRVFENKVRIETPELADGVFVIDGAKPAAYFIRPAVQVYMDARQSSRLTQWFVPVDPANPCRQWQMMTKLAGAQDRGDWRCERVGEETIDEHGVITYRAVSTQGQEFLGCVDPA